MNVINEHTGEVIETTSYVIKFRDQFLKKIRGDYDIVWCADIEGAKIYGSSDAMMKDLNKIARGCAYSGPFPLAYEFVMKQSNVIDHTERFLKNKQRAKKAEETKERNYRERNAQRDRDNTFLRLQQLQDEYNRTLEIFNGFGRGRGDDK